MARRARRVSDPKWRRRKDERPAEIINAAVATFAERGYAAARLEEVAARAGISRATLYLYFPNKEELFKAAVRRLIVPVLDQRQKESGAPSRSTAELLREFIASVPRQIESTGVAAIPKLVIAESSNFPDLARFYFNEVPSRARHNIAALVRRAVERGEFAPIDPDHAFFCIVAPMFMAVLWRNVFGPFDPHAPDLDALCRTHLDLVLRGLKSEESE
jgi:AcrR family transcriptional regulator